MKIEMSFDAREPDCISQAIVVKKGEDAVTIGISHPLAGVALNFDIHIMSLWEATKEEIDHGYDH